MINKNKSLKKEILKLLILFSISIIITVGVIAIINQYNSKINRIKHNQVVVLKQVKKEVEHLTSDIERISNYLSLNYLIHNDLLKNIVDTNNNISSILILNRSGIIEDFYSQRNINIYKGFDYSTQAYFKSLKNNQKYWSSVFLSAIDEGPTISFSFRMKDKIGVIMISLSNLSEFISDFKNHDASRMVRIFDKKGIMIINPDEKQMVLQRYNAISSEVFTKLINKKQAFESITYESLTDSSKELGSYTKFEKTGWNIVVRESHRYVLKTLNSVILTIIMAIFIFIIISIYISLRFSKKLFKSFDDMEDITSKISGGNYNVKEKDMEYDEFDKLLNSFNKMQVQIDKREDNLQNSLDSFKSLFNSTMESIILHENQICIDINDVCLDLFKAKSKDEIIGKNILELVAPEFRDMVASKYHRNSNPYEIELLKMDGTKIQSLVQGKFLNIRGQKIKVSALIDITELKNKDNLLFQQSKMASMGEMIGNIAHQWRQPLSIVSTCASGIKLEKEFGNLSDEKLHESMDMIVEHTQYLSRTIDDFRNFFKSEKNIKKFVIKYSVENALKLLSSSLKNNDIKIKVDFLDDDFEYEGYPNEFIQAFINIVNNSKDAFVVNNKEERFIEVSERILNDKYLLQIKDNAGGIPKNIKDRIFDPYFTTKHKSQGTGIGLYMTHQIIVDHMKGKVKIKNINFKKDNRTYNGSCFTIEFPINKDDNYTYMI